MATRGSGSINDSSTDYELIQPRDGRLERGYSIREAKPTHLKKPPQHLPHNPPQKNHLSNSRQRKYRLSVSRSRNYAELHGKRQSESEYAIPTTQAYTITRDTEDRHSHKYDAFFQGSVDESIVEDENVECSRSLTRKPQEAKSHRRCKCGCIKSILLFVTLIITLLVALTALGLGLYGMFVGHNSSSHDAYTHTWCNVTMTRAAFAVNCTQYSVSCTTETLATNITGFTSPRFHCLATHQSTGVPLHTRRYNNTLYRGNERAYCACQFELSHISRDCTIIGDYCMEG